MSNNQVYFWAFKDITKYIKEQKIVVMDDNFDVWYVTPNMMKSKEIRMLNNELGLHKVNKFGDRMRRTKK